MSDEREFIRSLDKDYKLRFNNYGKITSKTYKLMCEEGKCYILKKTSLYTDEKYKFLSSQGIDNVIYPIQNEGGKYVTNKNNQLYYLMDYIPPTNNINEIKAKQMNNQLTNLHFNTYYKKQLSPKDSRRKMEDIYEYLQYKFNVLEVFVRTLEARPFDEYSITILKNYHNILDAKKIMGNLQKKLITDIKEKRSINYSFIHNNPKLNHLISYSGKQYLISLEHSKVGIPSLDIVKFYLETEDLNIDKKELIMDYFSHYEDDFYYDYFCFFVLLYYIKGIVIIDKDYVSSQSFLYASFSIKKFIETFDLSTEK